MAAPALPAGYADWLARLKAGITDAPQRAALSVNTELVRLYGRIGQDILPGFHFDFLGLGSEAQEREIEGGLMRYIPRFLLKLGAGFAFDGRQFRQEQAI